MANYYIQTLGCKVNQCESEKLESELLDMGHQISFLENADVFVINTCTVTQVADKKSRQMIRRAKRNNPNVLVVAMGCFVEQLGEEEKENLKIDCIIRNEDKIKASQILNELTNSRFQNKIEDSKSLFEGNTRTHLKIQDGCNQFCSYCIIPYVRGRSVSRPIEEILKEVRIAAQKHSEIVLTGIHISSYGKDMSPKIDLIYLLTRIFQEEHNARIRLGSLEPRIITKELLEVVSSQSNFCAHFHLSLQSGSETILRAMNRKYTALEYEQGVHLIREYFPNAAITTDVIVGFPGESENEFLESLSFVEKMQFSMVHLFPYSKRKGTKAYDLPNQISASEKEKRMKKMYVVTQKSQENYLESFLGKEEEVIFEKEIYRDEKLFLEGHGKHYQKILTENIKYILNTPHKVFINDRKNDILYTE